MKVAYRRPLIDPSFSYVDMSEDDLYAIWKAYYPMGSGPLGVMKTACAFIENLAYTRDMNVWQWPDRFAQELSS